jgi:hypothetical protein
LYRKDGAVEIYVAAVGGDVAAVGGAQEEGKTG